MNVASRPSTRELVRARTAKGDTPREIALVLGITTQAVYKHLKALRAETEKTEAAS